MNNMNNWQGRFGRINLPFRGRVQDLMKCLTDPILEAVNLAYFIISFTEVINYSLRYKSSTAKS